MTLLTDGRIPVWLSGAGDDMCGPCADEGFVNRAAARLGENPYCSDHLLYELVLALQASKILGAIRNEPLPKVGV